MKPPHTSGTPSNRLLAALPQPDRALIAPHLKGVTLRPREVLQEVHDEVFQVHFPHTGMISIFAVIDDGEAIETASVGCDGAIGALAALGIKRATGRAVVQISGEASRISAAHLQKAARESERIRDMILRSSEALAMQTQQSAACGALHDVECRLARWLLQAHDRSSGGPIHLIQEVLAQALGVRRTTVNLVIGKLQDDKLIRYRRGRVEIIDRNGLMARSCSCYRIIRRQIDRIVPARGA